MTDICANVAGDVPTMDSAADTMMKNLMDFPSFGDATGLNHGRGQHARR